MKGLNPDLDMLTEADKAESSLLRTVSGGIVGAASAAYLGTNVVVAFFAGFLLVTTTPGWAVVGATAAGVAACAYFLGGKDNDALTVSSDSKSLTISAFDDDGYRSSVTGKFQLNEKGELVFAKTGTLYTTDRHSKGNYIGLFNTNDRESLDKFGKTVVDDIINFNSQDTKRGEELETDQKKVATQLVSLITSSNREVAKAAMELATKHLKAFKVNDENYSQYQEIVKLYKAASKTIDNGVSSDKAVNPTVRDFSNTIDLVVNYRTEGEGEVRAILDSLRNYQSADKKDKKEALSSEQKSKLHHYISKINHDLPENEQIKFSGDLAALKKTGELSYLIASLELYRANTIKIGAKKAAQDPGNYQDGNRPFMDNLFGVTFVDGDTNGDGIVDNRDQNGKQDGRLEDIEVDSAFNLKIKDLQAQLNEAKRKVLEHRNREERQRLNQAASAISSTQTAQVLTNLQTALTGKLAALGRARYGAEDYSNYSTESDILNRIMAVLKNSTNYKAIFAFGSIEELQETQIYKDFLKEIYQGLPERVKATTQPEDLSAKVSQLIKPLLLNSLKKD